MYQSILLHIRGTIVNVLITFPSGLRFHYSNAIPFLLPLSFSIRCRFSCYNPARGSPYPSIFVLSVFEAIPAAMRLAEFMILLCLLSLAFDASDAVARVTCTVSKCKFKRLHFRSEHLSEPEKYNNTSAEDKRVVPTGPNPLHNR
jgi:hypothetical protein